MKAQSKPYQFLQLVYGAAWGSGGKSWQRLNWSLSGALAIAIKVGMKFELGDIAAIYHDFKGCYWFGRTGQNGSGEQFFTRAVKAGNTSACLSFESWRKRPPFIFRGRRLYEGAELPLDGKRAVVTSFSADGSTITVCTYANTHEYNEGTYSGDGKPLTRTTLAPADVRSLLKNQIANYLAKFETAQSKDELNDLQKPAAFLLPYLDEKQTEQLRAGARAAYARFDAPQVKGASK